MAADGGDLGSFVEEVVGEGRIRVEDDLGDGYVRLRSSEAQRRQAAQDIRCTEDVVIELLRNSRDAGARNVFLALSREGSLRRVVVLDDGEGVPERMHERVFEPRVTSKLDTMREDKWGVHGRGMALYSISVNAVSARIVASEKGRGCALLVATDLETLGEKADQSSFPRFERADSGVVAVRGPRNILRTCCEFVLETSKSCTLYVGSPAEVASTLYALGRCELDPHELAFCRDPEALPVTRRLSLAVDAQDLARAAASVGLELSERTARRILDSEIDPLAPLASRIAREIAGEGRSAQTTEAASRTAHAPDRAAHDARGLKIDADDLARFSNRVAAAFSDLARDYYLDPSVEPQVRVSKDELRVSIPVVKL